LLLVSLAAIFIVYAPGTRDNLKNLVPLGLVQQSSETGQEEQMPVVILNEHPEISVQQSSLTSFDFVTSKFQNYLNQQEIEKLVIHISPESQYINDLEILDDPESKVMGFGADKVLDEAHVYLYMNRDNLLKYSWSQPAIGEKLEVNLISGLILLRREYDHISPTEIAKEAYAKYRLIDVEKDHRSLFVVEL
ncbi:MAG: hypothetical protein U9Q82_00520, partial [Chloroflexota bacterium]|nr:hypothetical protein [Chloroflexota bacterium]